MKHSFYKKYYEKLSAFISARPFFKKALPVLDTVLTALFFVSYSGLCFYALAKKMQATILMDMIFPLFLSLLIVTVLRLAIPRPRPYSEEGAGIIPIIKKKKGENNSFPSRHIACAAVITCVFFPHFPLIAISLLFFTFLLAFVRFALGVHYLSDLLAGGAIGFVIGLIMLIL